MQNLAHEQEHQSINVHQVGEVLTKWLAAIPSAALYFSQYFSNLVNLYPQKLMSPTLMHWRDGYAKLEEN